MVKALIYVAVVADILFVVSSTGQESHSETRAEAYAYSSTYPNPVCTCHPPEKPICEKHEVFSHCVQRQCTPRRCSEVGFPRICPKVEDYDCEKGCICEKGYVRNAKGDCVPINHCPPKCGKHEVFSHCVQRHCTPRKCSEVGYPENCPKVEDYDCEKGCICEKGYVRNSKGDCIPINHCPFKCGKHEVFSHCVQRQCTPRKCSEVEYPESCPKVEDYDCEKGCICEKGYVRNAKGDCIPINHCSFKCGKHEVFSHCVQRQCTPRKCSEVGYPENCPKVEDYDCDKGCICEKGYVRNAKGDCVPISHCQPICEKHEVFSHCVQRQCTPRKCSEVGYPSICPKVEDCDCQKGCICEKGYVKNAKGDCVPISHCPSKCGKHEVFSHCVQRQCTPRKCSEVGYPGICPKVEDCDCQKGCICEKGYVRNAKGDCVPINHCPSCDGPNEKYACGGACDNVCETLHIQNQTNCKVVNVRCNDACYCNEGYARDKNNICIEIEKCPPPKCGKNEVFSNCKESQCGPRNCSEVGSQTECPKHSIKSCTRGCICNEGHVRDKDNKCIPVNQCPHNCGKNAVYSDCIQGQCRPKNCTEVGSPVACVRIKPEFCEKGCICEEGYARKTTGECVPVKECPPNCGKNAVYSDCIQGQCRPKNCTEVGSPVACVKIKPEYCEKGCICEEGYARKTTGECVPVKECPPNCGKNAVYSDCIQGQCRPKNCTEVGSPVACVKIKPEYCEKGCICDEGYAKTETGECVPLNKCPPKCGINEVSSHCVQSTCDPQYCTELGFPVACRKIDPKYCKRGCLCKKNYVRNAKGICIDAKKCTSCGGDRRAITGCGNHCGNLCSNFNSTEPIFCTLICKRNGCDCRKGHVYDTNTGLCVHPKDCTPTCRTNEVYDKCTKPSCRPHKCSELGIPINCTNPPPCQKGCVCKPGYVKNEKGDCIPTKECPPTCRTNEVYDNCTNPSCRPHKCSELGFPLNCTNPPACQKGCVCKPGYVKNEKDDCIPTTECPSCGGDCRAITGCGNHCGNLCSNYNSTKPVFCTLFCKQNSCDCRKGHVYDTNTGLCVLPKDCTPTCRTNEVYDKCTKPSCRPHKCSELGIPINCTNPPPCQKGCVCKSGYVKNEKGDCIPTKECPPTCRTNEVYDNCTNPSCRPHKCSELGFPLNCTNPPACQKGCVCKPGYVKNEKDDCIPTTECPSCGGDCRAITGCGNHCGNLCSNYNSTKHVFCPHFCKQNSCDCKKGHVYDTNTGLCVLPKDCTPTCRTNEVYDKCTKPSCRPHKCSELGIPLKCTNPPSCHKGCVCKPGYVKNEKGDCIPTKECPLVCGIDEVIDTCINDDSRIRNCSELKGPKTCTNGTKCISGCACKDGYLRKNDGKCVPTQNCTEAQCGDNEEFNMCPSALCEPQHCNQLGFPIHCPNVENHKCPGLPGCICINDHVRDEHGKCIPKRQCPSCGGDDNAWAGCGICGRNCDDLDGKKKICPRIVCPRNACECKEDYYYDNELKQCVAKDCCKRRCTKPNEEYVKCPPSCGSVTCKGLNQTYHCPKMPVNETDCVGECRCIKGFFRNLIGECISKDNCNKCPDPFEYWSCGSPCDNVCSELHKQSKDNCPIMNKKCTAKCYCADGYARNANGTCIQICDCPGDPAPVNSTISIANFKEANIRLAVNFMCDLLDSKPGENFMFSAFSVLIALAQLAYYAIGLSAEQLLTLLNLKSKCQIRTICPILIENYKSQQQVTFDLAIKYYGNLYYTFTEQFKSDAVNIFGSEGQNINFANKKAAAADINEWVANNTNQRIKNLVNPSMFDANTEVVFVNAMYFLGKWIHQFNKQNTQPREFYLNDNDKVTIPIMYQQNTFRYAENETLDAKILQLSYRGNFSLYVFLPNQKTGLREMAAKLRAPGSFSSSIRSMRSEKVNVYMPLMNFSTDISELIKFLQENNVTAPIRPGNNFKGITVDNRPLAITDVIQKSVFIVNENGTEAAVATGVVVGITAVRESKSYTFDVNHPCAFFLCLDDDPMFAGAFVGAT